MMTRRGFLAVSACAGLAAPQAGTALVDLRTRCRLPESRAGYLTVFAGTEDESPACETLFVPAADLDADSAGRLAACVRRGSCVVFEGGERDLLWSHFGLQTGPPVDLWHTGERDPYLDYMWPLRVKFRDFSRVLPPHGGEVIALAGTLPVAARQRIGNGMLIFLGSPVGPLLLDGDPDARRWLKAVALA